MSDVYNIRGICCICGEVFRDFGNNPAPVKNEGRCCDECNNKVVIPKRIELAYETKSK